MKLKRSLLPLLLGLAISFVASAETSPSTAPSAAGPMAQPPAGRMAPPPGGMMAPGMPAPPPPPFAGVQFTPEQQQRINAMMEKERDAHQQRLERMQRSQQKLQQLYQAEVWDPKAIAKVYDEIFAEQRNTVEAMAEARNRVYELMTPEQRQQMRRFQPQRPPMRQQ